MGKSLSKPQRQSGALTADVLAVIRLTAVQPRRRGRGIETPEQAAERARFDLALVAALSDGGLRRSEAAALTWGDAQRWDDGSGRITVIRSKTDVEAAGAVVAIIPVAMRALDVIRPAGVASSEESVGAVGVADRPAGEDDRQSRRTFRLGVLQRSQRAPGAAGSRARRHGRPLHPRRDRRVGAQVSLSLREHGPPAKFAPRSRSGGSVGIRSF